MLTFGLNDLFLSICIHLTRNIYFTQTSVQTYMYTDYYGSICHEARPYLEAGYSGHNLWWHWPSWTTSTNPHFFPVKFGSALARSFLSLHWKGQHQQLEAGPRFWLTSFILHFVLSQSFSYLFIKNLLLADSPRPRHTTTSCWNRVSRETSKIIVNNGLWLLEATEKHEWPALSRPCVSSWTCQVTKVMVKNNDEPMMTYKCRISWPLPLDGTWNMLKISVPTLDSSYFCHHQHHPTHAGPHSSNEGPPGVYLDAILGTSEGSVWDLPTPERNLILTVAFIIQNVCL